MPLAEDQDRHQEGQGEEERHEVVAQPRSQDVAGVPVVSGQREADRGLDGHHSSEDSGDDPGRPHRALSTASPGSGVGAETPSPGGRATAESTRAVPRARTPRASQREPAGKMDVMKR